MNYEKLAGSIRAVIDRRPKDTGAYSDLFSLCREWETEDFTAAHLIMIHLTMLTFAREVCKLGRRGQRQTINAERQQNGYFVAREPVRWQQRTQQNKNFVAFER